jgi:hypothetical protein
MDRKTHGIYSMAQASTAGLGTDPLKTGGHYCPRDGLQFMENYIGSETVPRE